MSYSKITQINRENIYHLYKTYLSSFFKDDLQQRKKIRKTIKTTISKTKKPDQYIQNLILFSRSIDTSLIENNYLRSPTKNKEDFLNYISNGIQNISLYYQNNQNLLNKIVYSTSLFSLASGHRDEDILKAVFKRVIPSSLSLIEKIHLFEPYVNSNFSTKEGLKYLFLRLTKHSNPKLFIFQKN